MKKLFVGNLPSTTTEESLRELFSPFGKVHSVDVVIDIFSGQCRGFGFVEMEGHEARSAIAALDRRDYDGKPLRVNFETPRRKGGRR